MRLRPHYITFTVKHNYTSVAPWIASSRLYSSEHHTKRLLIRISKHSHKKFYFIYHTTTQHASDTTKSCKNLDIFYSNVNLLYRVSCFTNRVSYITCSFTMEWKNERIMWDSPRANRREYLLKSHGLNLSSPYCDVSAHGRPGLVVS